VETVLCAQCLIVGPLMMSPWFRGYVWLNLATCFASDNKFAEASFLASMISGANPTEVMENTTREFRYVKMADVQDVHVVARTNDDELRSKTCHAKMDEVDAFFSHSWRDRENKWDVWQIWRQQFLSEHGEEPKVWLDKCCIDQDNTKLGLMCLPVYLASCRGMVISVGETFLSRLWCIIEMFVYMQIHSGDKDISKYLTMVPITTPTCSLEQILAGFNNFDVANADCKRIEEKHLLLSVIESSFGSLDNFNRTFMDLIEKANIVGNLQANGEIYQSENAGLSSVRQSMTTNELKKSIELQKRVE